MFHRIKISSSQFLLIDKALSGTINQKYHSETAVALALAAVSTISMLSGVAMVVRWGRHVKCRVAVKKAYWL